MTGAFASGGSLHGEGAQVRPHELTPRHSSLPLLLNALLASISSTLVAVALHSRGVVQYSFVLVLALGLHLRGFRTQFHYLILAFIRSAISRASALGCFLSRKRGEVRASAKALVWRQHHQKQPPGFISRGHGFRFNEASDNSCCESLGRLVARGPATLHQTNGAGGRDETAKRQASHPSRACMLLRECAWSELLSL